MAKFTKGKSVQLNGSSTCITVADVIIEDSQISYKCTWIDKEGKPQNEIYEEELLSECKSNLRKFVRDGIDSNKKLIDEDGFPVND